MFSNSVKHSFSTSILVLFIRQIKTYKWLFLIHTSPRRESICVYVTDFIWGWTLDHEGASTTKTSIRHERVQRETLLILEEEAKARSAPEFIFCFSLFFKVVFENLRLIWNQVGPCVYLTFSEYFSFRIVRLLFRNSSCMILYISPVQTPTKIGQINHSYFWKGSLKLLIH